MGGNGAQGHMHRAQTGADAFTHIHMHACIQVAVDLEAGVLPAIAQLSPDDIEKCLAGDAPPPEDPPVLAAQVGLV